ncbi:hypothetical protein [Cohnella sp. REN36]|uniref:hypothetical protein n=1 Tax=Cohnella sp. REN36 TaxID=2887347 RepID=UPI001D142C5D|nr:hypothetical protein [Cohnella sp. REN36]MCC3377373.1 hypothetical protein [Cohnella sp. REN36]
MERIELEDRPIREASFQMLFPFSLTADCHGKMRESLLDEGFVPFRLDDMAQQDAYYGPNHRVSHRNMERYYLPFTNHVLFPHEHHPEGFQRMSKKLDLRAALHMRHFEAPFDIYSVDVVLCPFDTGFITLRVGLAKASPTLTEAIEFAERLRALQNAKDEDEAPWVACRGEAYAEVQDFIFKAIVPHTVQYLDRTPMDGAYFEKLPYLIDERMYVIAYYAFPEDARIGLTDRYRAARLDGMDEEGRPYISASHLPYIEQYCRDTGFDRWAPDTYYMTEESCFCCLTTLPEDQAARVANKMYGEYYYGLLLNLFHRIVLLKLSNAYSRVRLERTPAQTEVLIRAITTFSAKYDFLEVVSQSQGREIFVQIRRMYGNDELFEDVKMTLTDLYKYQENATSKRSSYLLTVLTIYTVISGIYGMNQVIDDLEGPIRWGNMGGYSFFQWLALIVILSGLIVAFLLTGNILWKWGRDLVKRLRGYSGSIR